MKTAKIIPTSTLMVAALGLALGLAAAPALADPVDEFGCHGPHKPICDPDPDPSGGGKPLLFVIADPLICGGATNTMGDSHGQVTVNNVLWDPLNIHVHFKLQLKDVDPGEYPIFGNNAIECVNDPMGAFPPPNTVDVPACEGGNCTPGFVSVTVKQNGQGRTSGVLQLPGRNCGDTTTVWVTVIVNSFSKILRSTPVTIVLPPNAVGDESCL
jgi:hypothetical protein